MTKRRRVLAAGFAVLATGAAFAIGPANPAQAANPTCTVSNTFTGTAIFDWDGETVGLFFMPAYKYPGFDEYTFICALRYGNTGRGVEALQQTLNQCYRGTIGQQLVVDGQFGSKTQAALIKAQRVERIADDGQYGPQTQRTIDHWTWLPQFGHWSCQMWRP